MVNLLYVIEGGHPGGAEQNLLTVIRAIDKTQFVVKICLLRASEILENELKKLGICVLLLNMTGKWDVFSILKLCGVMRREKIDIVHSCLYASNTIGRIAAVFTRVPVIITWEQGEILYPKTPSRHYIIDKFLASFSDCIVACSKACKEAIIRKEGVLEDSIRVIYNCVDLNKFVVSSGSSEIRKQFVIDADEILIGNVSTLDNEKKSQEYLIKALPKILNSYPKMKLLLVGRDGSSKAFFVQLTESLGISNKVIFTGFREDIPQIMSALDIYVCSSLMEGLSISILEAMSSKKPVVSTSVYGNSELIIDKQTGYLVEPRNADSIAQAVISLLADRQKMREFGEAGYERVRIQFSSTVIVKQIETLYRELLCKKHPKFQ